mgnify:CR=1 FL=1
MRLQLNRRGEAAQTMVEFALILPVLLMLVFGIFEFGRAFFAYNAITNATREAARYGTVDPTNTIAIQQTAVDSSVGIGITTANVTVQCLNASVETADSCVYNNRLRVTVSYTFTAVVPIVPDIPMTGVSTMRIE